MLMPSGFLHNPSFLAGFARSGWKTKEGRPRLSSTGPRAPPANGAAQRARRGVVPAELAATRELRAMINWPGLLELLEEEEVAAVRLLWAILSWLLDVAVRSTDTAGNKRCRVRDDCRQCSHFVNRSRCLGLRADSTQVVSAAGLQPDQSNQAACGLHSS